MDKIITESDIKNKNTLVYQCRDCKNWTIHTDYLSNKEYIPCIKCGKIDYDQSSGKSLRSYNPFADKKRKPK